MKIIGRAALWLIDKFIYLLIGKKDFTPALDLDDWPPDGSMHFLRFNQPIGSTGLPPNAVQYEFAANVGEDDPVVFSLGQEIISRFCGSRKTLIVFSFDPEPLKHKRQESAAPLTEIISQFLHSLVPEASIIRKENMVVCLGIGHPKELLSQYQAAPDMLYYFDDTYLFFEKNEPLCPEEGLAFVKNGKYQVCFYLGTGPNALNIVCDSESLDITELKIIIEEVCRSHNIPLINPPVLPEIK